MTPHTVLQVSDSTTFGGTEQVIVQLLSQLDPGRWQCLLLHQPWGGEAHVVEAARRLGVPVHAAHADLTRHGWRGVLPLARQLREMRPTVVHAHLTTPSACRALLAAAALARVPAIVATVHLFSHSSTVSLRSAAVQRLIGLGVDGYIAVSRETAALVERELGVPRAKIRTVHNGVPLPRTVAPRDCAVRRELTGGRPIPVALVVGRLEKHKGHQYLLEAAPQVPDALFAFAGDGPLRVALEAQARAFGVGDRVRFLGHRTDVPRLLAACDLVVQPSLVEGMPLAILEAMACGKPVVGTSIGGIDEAIVHGQTGLLVPPGNADALARAILRLLGDPRAGWQMGAQARARVAACFRIDDTVRRVSDVYDELVR